MKDRICTTKIIFVLGLATLALGVTAGSASASSWGVFVGTPLVYPVAPVVVPAPIVAAPVTAVYPAGIYPAPVVGAYPIRPWVGPYPSAGVFYPRPVYRYGR